MAEILVSLFVTELVILLAAALAMIRLVALLHRVPRLRLRRRR